MVKNLYDLYGRLVKDYNDGVQFEQREEDRLALRNAIDLLYSYTCNYAESKLEKLLVHHRFCSLPQIVRVIEETLKSLNCKVNGIEESWKNEDEDYEYNDYEAVALLQIDGLEYYLTVYYLKTRNDELYITELCLEEE